MEQNWKCLFIYPLSALLFPLPLLPFTTEKITGSSLKVLKNLQEICLPVFYFMFYCFSNSKMNTLEYCNDFIILMSFISSFKMNKVNSFPALTAPFPLIFLSNSFIAFEVKLLTNPGKLSLPIGIAIFATAFFPKLPKQEPKDPHDWTITKFYICWHIIRKGISYFSCFSCC